MADTQTRSKLNRRSRTVTEGDQRAPNRAMLRAVGFGDDDFDKPIVGVANGHSTITPCNAGLGDLGGRGPRAALRAGGGMPQVFGTITVSDGISMGTEGMKYSLVSREVIADSHRDRVPGPEHGRRARRRRLRQEHAGRDDRHRPPEHPGDFRLRRHHQARPLRRART